MDKVEAVVVGAGVIGLAVARALAMRGLEVIVLEAANAIGTGISSRSSEVVHGGIYYEPGSLKARTCVAGKGLLYAFCDSHGVAYRRCGKLIVATSASQEAALRLIATRALANGVDDLQWLSGAEARVIEPELACVAALLSPSTGIVDSHGLMLALQGDLESASGVLALASPVEAMRVAGGGGGRRRGVGAGDIDRRGGGGGNDEGSDRGNDGIVLEVGGAVATTLLARRVVNAAGLWAPALASRIAGLPVSAVPRASFAKGHYFSLASRAPFSHLVYPVPQDAGLGVHLTFDLAGQARFGPDVEWVEPGVDGRLDYRVDASRATRFEAEVRRYWPGLPQGALQPAYSGIRPKLGAPVSAASDFVLQGPAQHGVAGLVNMYGIESPGLTSCLALAQEVAAMLA